MNGKVHFSGHPRHIFVSMLFALAIGKLAQVGYEIIATDAGLGVQFQASMHWLLALAVILTSWVDWSESFGQVPPPASGVFTTEFFILVLDVFILFAYFSLIASIDSTKNVGHQAVRPEIISVIAIFFLYTIWDYVSYVKPQILDISEAVLPPVVCLLLASILFFLSGGFEFEGWRAGWVSVALLLNLGLFRLLHRNRKTKMTTHLS